MKRIFTSLFTVSLLAACGSGETEKLSSFSAQNANGLVWSCKSTDTSNDAKIEIARESGKTYSIVYYSAKRGLSWLGGGLTLTRSGGFTPSDLFQLKKNAAGDSVELFVNYLNSTEQTGFGHAKIFGYSNTLIDSDITCGKNADSVGTVNTGTTNDAPRAFLQCLETSNGSVVQDGRLEATLFVDQFKQLSAEVRQKDQFSGDKVTVFDSIKETKITGSGIDVRRPDVIYAGTSKGTQLNIELKKKGPKESSGRLVLNQRIVSISCQTL